MTLQFETADTILPVPTTKTCAILGHGWHHPFSLGVAPLGCENVKSCLHVSNHGYVLQLVGVVNQKRA